MTEETAYSPDPQDRWAPIESRVRSLAHAFPYPPTPDLSARAAKWMKPLYRPRIIQPRRAAWIVAGLVVLLLALMAVPPVRAQVIQWIRIGAVEIFRFEPSPVPAPPATSMPVLGPTSTDSRPPTAVPASLDLDGQTTLEEARERVTGLPVRLPEYPEDLGEPHQVYLQDSGGPVVILVWFDEGSTRNIRLVLYEIGPTAVGFEKFNTQLIEETTVNGQPAVWAVGPYLLKDRSGDMRLHRLVQGATLVWVEDEITYRLESGLALDEARRIAESLQPAVPE